MNLTAGPVQYIVTLPPARRPCSPTAWTTPGWSACPTAPPARPRPRRHRRASPGRDHHRPQSATCGPDCQASPCTLRQMRQARRAAEADPRITWWAELTVLAHLTGWAMPFPGPDFTADLRAMDRAAATARWATRSTTRSRPGPGDHRRGQPGPALAVHVTAAMRAALDEQRWACERPRAAVARPRLAVGRGSTSCAPSTATTPAQALHPLTRELEARYDRTIPGRTGAEQAAAVQRWHDAAQRDPKPCGPSLSGVRSPSGLERAAGAAHRRPGLARPAGRGAGRLPGHRLGTRPARSAATGDWAMSADDPRKPEHACSRSPLSTSSGPNRTPRQQPASRAASRGHPSSAGGAPPSRTEHNQARRGRAATAQGPAMPADPVTAAGRRPTPPARATGAGAERPAEQAQSSARSQPGSRGRASAEAPSRTEHNEARRARPPIERAQEPPERRDTDSSWPPSQADRDSARALYREYRKDRTTTDPTGSGHERGTKSVGEKDNESPGEASGRPPTGPELLKAEGKETSRGDKFQKQVNEDIGDVIDLGNTGVETVKDLMAQPSPTGHPEVLANSHPAFGPETPQHAGVDPSAVAEMTLVLGVIGFQAGRWLHHKIEKPRKE